MHILIGITKKDIKITLFDGKKEIDFLVFPEEYNLSQRLLLEIDKILEKNNKTSKDVSRISVESSENVTLTTERIAKSVAKSFNLAKKLVNDGKTVDN